MEGGVGGSHHASVMFDIGLKKINNRRNKRNNLVNVAFIKTMLHVASVAIHTFCLKLASKNRDRNVSQEFNFA